MIISSACVRFFPVFFQQECGLSPVGVNAIFVVAPFLMAGVSPLAQKISSCGVGRMQTSLLFQWLGISMLALMALRDFGSFDLWTDKLLGVKSGAVMLMYIGRTVRICGRTKYTSGLLRDMFGISFASCTFCFVCLISCLCGTGADEFHLVCPCSFCVAFARVSFCAAPCCAAFPRIRFCFARVPGRWSARS